MSKIYLAGVHALVGDEGLGVVLELVWLKKTVSGYSDGYSKDRWNRTLRKVTLARGAPVVELVRNLVPALFKTLRQKTYHDRNRGQSPSRHPGCIHCAQPVFISPMLSFRLSAADNSQSGAAATYKVERAELGGGLVQTGVGGEDRAATLTLVPDNPTHGDGVVIEGVCRDEKMSWSRWRECGRRKIRLLTCSRVSAPRPHSWLTSGERAPHHHPRRVMSCLAKITV